MATAVVQHPSSVEGREANKQDYYSDAVEHHGDDAGEGDRNNEQAAVNVDEGKAETPEHKEGASAGWKPNRPFLPSLVIGPVGEVPEVSSPLKKNKFPVVEKPPMTPTSREGATLASLYRRVHDVLKAAGRGHGNSGEEKLVSALSTAPGYVGDGQEEASPVAGVLELYSLLKKSASYDEDGTVTVNDLRGALVTIRVNLDDEEVSLLNEYYSEDDQARIPLETFLLDCAGGITLKRLELARGAFQLVDNEGNGVIRVQDMRLKFRAAEHPRVKSGELTAEHLWKEFVGYFERNRADGTVHPVEWEFYYAEISSQIASDEYFENMMFACWPDLKKEQEHTVEMQKIVLTAKAKRHIAVKFRKLEVIVKDHRTFRDALSLAFHRSSQLGDHHLERDELHQIVSEFYRICGISTSELDDVAFDAIHRRVMREAGTKARTLTDYEAAMHDALLRECRFLEYQLYAVTV